MNDKDKKRFSVTLTGRYKDALDSLVKKGLYLDHQDVIRSAMRHLFQHHGVKSFALKKVDPDR